LAASVLPIHQERANREIEAKTAQIQSGNHWTEITETKQAAGREVAVPMNEGRSRRRPKCSRGSGPPGREQPA